MCSTLYEIKLKFNQIMKSFELTKFKAFLKVKTLSQSKIAEHIQSSHSKR